MDSPRRPISQTRLIAAPHRNHIDLFWLDRHGGHPTSGQQQHQPVKICGCGLSVIISQSVGNVAEAAYYLVALLSSGWGGGGETMRIREEEEE